MIKHVLKKWARREDGATAIEYSMIAAGISLMIMANVFLFGESLMNLLATFSGWFTLID